jgi:hypothetical protein
MDKKLKFEANITLMLREKDVNLLLNAVKEYTAKNGEELRVRHHLLGVLEYLATPE